MTDGTMTDPSEWPVKFFQVLFRNAPDRAVTKPLLRECLEALPHALKVVPHAHELSSHTVIVPRELLRQVLEAAEEDSLHSQLMSGVLANQVVYEADRARIAELRRAAGMEEDQ